MRILAAEYVVLVLVIGHYNLLTLTAYNLTTVPRRSKVAVEQEHEVALLPSACCSDDRTCPKSLDCGTRHRGYYPHLGLVMFQHIARITSSSD